MFNAELTVLYNRLQPPEGRQNPWSGWDDPSLSAINLAFDPVEYAQQFRERGFAFFPRLLDEAEVDRPKSHGRGDEFTNRG